MLRLCQEADCHDVWVINKEEMGYDVPFEVAHKQLERVLIDPSQRVYVYECDNRVVGYIHACRYDLLYHAPMVNIMGIAVLKDYQHNGIGGLLLLMIEDWASDLGISAVRLNTGKEREIAHLFYDAWGYTCQKEQLKYLKSLED